MSKPVRIRLSRAKGSDLQARSLAVNGLPAVNVARPSKCGNPFTIADAIESGFVTGEGQARQLVVECFRDWLGPSQSGRNWWQGPDSDRRRNTILGSLPNLRGKNLACWCAEGEACHADVLLELANLVCEEVPA